MAAVGIAQIIAIVLVGRWAWRSAFGQIGEIRTATADEQKRHQESLLQADNQHRVSNALNLIDSFYRRLPYLYGDIAPSEAIEYLTHLENEHAIDGLVKSRNVYGTSYTEPTDPEAKEIFRKGLAAASVINNFYARAQTAIDGGIADRKVLYNLGYLANISLPTVRKVIAPQHNLDYFEKFAEQSSRNVTGAES
jgi:hypothetical protein